MLAYEPLNQVAVLAAKLLMSRFAMFVSSRNFFIAIQKASNRSCGIFLRWISIGVTGWEAVHI